MFEKKKTLEDNACYIRYLKLSSFYVLIFIFSFTIERNTKASEVSINNIISSLEKSKFVMDLAESAILLVLLQVVVILYTGSYLLIQKVQRDNGKIDTKKKEYKLKNAIHTDNEQKTRNDMVFSSCSLLQRDCCYQ